MLIGIILVIVIAVSLFALHYGYKLAFYYEDPLKSPYEYEEDDQTSKCKPVLDNAIAEFEKAAYEDVSITSHDGLKLTGRYYHVADGAPLEIHCHGYKGNATRDFCGAWKIACEAGHNVLLIDLMMHRRILLKKFWTRIWGCRSCVELCDCTGCVSGSSTGIY